MKINPQIEKYIKRVCKDKELRFYALCFCNDLIEKNKDKTFTREDFETLVIDGEEFEQDVVKKIFARQEVASFEEVFYQILQHNLSEICYEWGYGAGGITGVYNNQENFIEIYRDIYENNSKRTRIKELKDYLKGKKNYEKDGFMERYKHDLYHELGHVLSKKTFKNEQVVKVGCSNIYFNDFEYSSVDINLDTQKILNMENGRDWDFLNLLCMIKGIRLLDEIYNETFTCKTENTLFIKKEPISVFDESKFEQKNSLLPLCAYSNFYNIIKLVDILAKDYSVKEFMFNSKHIKEAIYNLDISDFTLALVKQDLINTYLLSNKNDSTRFSTIKALNNYLDFNPYYIFCYVLAFLHDEYNKLGSNDDSKIISNIDKYNLIAQNLLIEGIKNKWSNKIYDNNVVKDKKFFEELNEVLKTIDSYILYPKDEKEYYQKNEQGEVVKVIKTHYKTMPLSLLSKKCEGYAHLNSFNSLVEDVKITSKVYGNEIENFNEIMTFLKQQEDLGKDYCSLMQEHNDILLNKALENKEKRKEHKLKKEIEQGRKNQSKKIHKIKPLKNIKEKVEEQENENKV